MFEAKKQVADILTAETSRVVSSAEIEVSSHGDLSSNICFKLAGEYKKPPAEVASMLAEKISPQGIVDRVEALDGFLNFYLDYGVLGSRVVSAALKGDFGRGDAVEGKVVLEHTSINPSGPVHVGRLRNSIIGDSLRRILVFAGFQVETLYWVNDVGKQIALIAVAGKQGLGGDSGVEARFSDYSGKEDFQVFFTYVSANRLYEDDEDFRESVQNLIKSAESGDKESMSCIKDAAQKCLMGQKKTYDRLGFTFDCFDFESEEIESGRVFKVLDELRKSEFWVVKDGLGAGLDLSSFGIEKRSGLSVCQRDDSTTVYLARDLSYHLSKASHGDVLINVLGEDHKLEFDELSTILTKLLGFEKPLEAVHFSFVSFEGKKLSTRRGETLPVDILLDEAEQKASAEIKSRGIGSEETSPDIGVGALKYHIIKTAPSKPITFRWEDALAFEGDAAPYIQYAHARSIRILEKAGVSLEELEGRELDFTGLSVDEKDLIKVIAGFPESVRKAAGERRPHIIATYVYDLASVYSRFYKECKVLGEDEKIMERRLSLVAATKNTLKIGLGLLGINAPERM